MHSLIFYLIAHLFFSPQAQQQMLYAAQTASGGGGPATLVSGWCEGLGVSGGTGANHTVASGEVLLGAIFWYTAASSGRPTYTSGSSGTGDTISLLPDSSYVTNASVTQFYVQSPTASATYHFIATGTMVYTGLCVQRWTGLATSSVYDTSTQSGTAANTPTCAITGATPSAGKRLWSSAVADTDTSQPTVNSSYVINTTSGTGWLSYSAGSYFGGGIAYLYQSSSSAVSPTWTANQGACSQAAFKGL